MQEAQSQSLVGKLPWRKKWQPTPVFLPGESHGQRSLAGYSPWGRKESGMTERLSPHTQPHHQPTRLFPPHPVPAARPDPDQRLDVLLVRLTWCALGRVCEHRGVGCVCTYPAGPLSLCVRKKRCSLLRFSSALTLTTLTVLLTPDCGLCTPQAILQPHLGVLQLNSVLTLSTWSQSQIPQVMAAVPRDCPHFRHQSHVLSALLSIWAQVLSAPVLLTSQTEVRVPVTPTLGLITCQNGS